MPARFVALEPDKLRIASVAFKEAKAVLQPELPDIFEDRLDKDIADCILAGIHNGNANPYLLRDVCVDCLRRRYNGSSNVA